MTKPIALVTLAIPETQNGKDLMIENENVIKNRLESEYIVLFQYVYQAKTTIDIFSENNTR
jgi:hypothetical protein